MRAPPEAETTIAGMRSVSAASKQRAIFSPTTLPMLPPMKRKSNRPMATGWPSMRPVPHTAASRRPVLMCAASSRSGYALLVVEAERVAGGQAGVALDERALVEQQVDPLADAHPEVVPAGRADAKVALQLTC